MRTTKNALIALLVTTLLFTSNALNAQVHQHADMMHGKHTFFLPDSLKWQDGPAGLPAGSKIAVIDGDPTKKGLFTVRLKFPKGYTVPAHWHPTDEHITVIQGNFRMGMGDKLDRQHLMVLPVASFAVMPAKATHYAVADEECIVQIHAMGPFAITYVNPADDPRKK